MQKYFCVSLTHKQLETHWCILSTVATDGLVLQHQAINSHGADQIFIVLDQFLTKLLHLQWKALENYIKFWEKKTQLLKG